MRNETFEGENTYDQQPIDREHSVEASQPLSDIKREYNPSRDWRRDAARGQGNTIISGISNLGIRVSSAYRRRVYDEDRANHIREYTLERLQDIRGHLNMIEAAIVRGQDIQDGEDSDELIIDGKLIKLRQE